MLVPAAVHTRLTNPRLIDGFFALAITAGIGGLFFIDITEPRGVVDGIGYAAVVALASRFGARALIAVAALTTLLTLLGAGLVPDSGISVGGMWANRGFAMAEIWIVALMMRGRLYFEQRLEDHEQTLHRHQGALDLMIRECLLADLPFDERLSLFCRKSAEALGADAALIALRNPGKGHSTVLQSWFRHERPGFMMPGHLIEEDPSHKPRLVREHVVATEDMESSDFHAPGRRLARTHGIRALLAAEIFISAQQTGAVLCGMNEPHRWTKEEISFMRAASNLAALMIANQGNSDTLAALDLADDGIYTEDRGGQVRYSNRAARVLASASASGREFPRPDTPLESQHDFHEVRLGGRELEIYRARLRDGGLIVRLSDVTSRNAASAERVRLEDRLHQAAKMEAIGQLAGGVAHDFNNILGAITGFAGFIAQDATVESQNGEFARRILSAAKRGKQIVEQIMSFAETRVISHGVANLGRVMKESRDLLAGSMKAGVGLYVEMPEATILVRGSEVQIGQLISNLVNNARDALDKGGLVEIRASVATPVEMTKLRAFTNGGGEILLGEPRGDWQYARLEVRDNGSGITSEVIGRIFEPFFSTKGRQRGSGLGLAVVHGVVRAHDGLCHVKSQPGEGTTFSVYLPLVRDDTPSETRGRNPRVKPCRVLIVDDEADMADMLAIGLERLGFQTVAVQHPLAALAAIEEDPAAFDALLTDQRMPHMQGTELIGEVKRVAPAIRAILCTGNPEALKPGQAHQAEAVLQKPLDIQAVAAALSAPVPERAL